jgi:hypothetical protein
MLVLPVGVANSKDCIRQHPKSDPVSVLVVAQPISEAAKMATPRILTLRLKSMSVGDKHPDYVCDRKEQNCADRQKRCSGSSRAQSSGQNSLRQRVRSRRFFVLKRFSTGFAFPRIVALHVNGFLTVSTKLSVARKN